MEIYSYAKQINYNADYMDPYTGRIYHIQEYGRAIKLGLPTPGIRVSEDGETIGYATMPENFNPI